MKIKFSNSFLNVWLAALAAGVLFMEYFHRSPKFLIVAAAALIIGGIIFTWRRKNLTAWIICPIIFFALGGLRFFSVDNLPPNDVSKFAGQAVQISGVIREEPQKKILPNGVTQVRFVVDAESVKLNGADLVVSEKWLVVRDTNSNSQQLTAFSFQVSAFSFQENFFDSLQLKAFF